MTAQQTKFAHVKNFSGDRKCATMLLYSEIGQDAAGNGINGEAFANEIYALQDMGVEQINVRINSPGGSVIDGFSIFSAITHVKCNVDTFIDGMAASIAGVIAMAGKRVHMADIGMLMIHDPSMESDEPQTAKNREILSLIKNSLVTALTNKTGFDPGKMGDMMAKETWMDCKQARSYGFVDEIFTTNLPKENLAIVTNSVRDMAKTYLKFKNILQPTNTSMKKVAKFFNLAEEANEDSILNEIEKLKTAKDSLDAKILALEGEKKTLKDANDAFELEKTTAATTAATELVNEAVKANKIKDTEKDSWLVLAKANLSAVKNAFDGMGKSKVATKVTDAIVAGKKEVAQANDRTGWTYRDFEKKAPKELAEMKDNAPEDFKALFDSHMANIKAISAK